MRKQRIISTGHTLDAIATVKVAKERPLNAEAVEVVPSKNVANSQAEIVDALIEKRFELIDGSPNLETGKVTPRTRDSAVDIFEKPDAPTAIATPIQAQQKDPKAVQEVIDKAKKVPAKTKKSKKKATKTRKGRK